MRRITSEEAKSQLQEQVRQLEMGASLGVSKRSLDRVAVKTAISWQKPHFKTLK